MLQQSNSPISKQVLNDRKQYLEQHHDDLPPSELKKDTEKTLKEIEKADDAFWNTNCGSLSGLKKYQEKYPQGKHISEIPSKRSLLEYQKAQRNDQVDNALSTTKAVLKYGGLVVCVGLFILVIYTAITSDYKITWATLAPLAYATNRLMEW